MKHGTAHCYKTLKCRCDECRAEMARIGRETRAKNKKYALEHPEDPRHGILSFSSNYNCPCSKCREVRNDYIYEKRRGVPRTEMQKILDAQNGGCASCKRELLKPHYDHNHETGERRGVLCSQCNMALGLLGDDAERILALLTYRQSYN